MDFEVIEILMKIWGCTLAQTLSVYFIGEFSPPPKLFVYLPFNVQSRGIVIVDVYYTFRVSSQCVQTMFHF